MYNQQRGAIAMSKNIICPHCRKEKNIHNVTISDVWDFGEAVCNHCNNLLGWKITYELMKEDAHKLWNFAA